MAGSIATEKAGTIFSLARTCIRFLTFRSTADELRSFQPRHLVLGLLCTWVVGIGRWWEDPKASLLQQTGLGSVAYVLVLSLFLWLVLWPLTPPHWSLRQVLTFVSLTSPPAILYAIPVRHGLPLPTAQMVRLWLLAIVAGWRVALLVFYLRRGAGLAGWRHFIASVFPLLLIVFILTALNLEKVVFDFMGGIRTSDRSVNDAAYGVLFLITMLSMLAFLPVLAAYLAGSVNAVMDKYGRQHSRFFYILSMVLAVVGALAVFFGLAFPGCTLIGAALVVTGTVVLNRTEDADSPPASSP